MDINTQTGMPKGIMIAKGHAATLRVSALLKSHGATDEQLRGAFGVWDKLLDKKIKFQDFAKELQIALNCRADMAEVVAGELSASELKYLDPYFGGVDVFETAKQWMKHGRNFLFSDAGPINKNTASPISENVENEDLRGVNINSEPKPDSTDQEDEKVVGRNVNTHKRKILDKEKLYEITKKILFSQGVEGLTEDKLLRIQNIMLSQVKDVRDTNEATQMYGLGFENGGVGFDPEKAYSLASAISRLVEIGKLTPDKFYKEEVYEKSQNELRDPWEEYDVRSAGKKEIVSESYKKKLSLASILPKFGAKSQREDLSHQKYDEQDNAIPSSLNQKSNKLFSREEYVPKEPEKKRISDFSSANSGVLNLKKPEPFLKETEAPKNLYRVSEKMTDGISSEIKNKGPKNLVEIKTTEDLKKLTPSYLRMMGSKEDMLKNLSDGISELEKNGYSKADMFTKWQESELYTTYLDMGRQSIFSGNDIAKIATTYKDNGKPYLESSEFEVVADVSKMLQN